MILKNFFVLLSVDVDYYIFPLSYLGYHVMVTVSLPTYSTHEKKFVQNNFYHIYYICLEKRPARHINFSGKNFSLENIHDKNLIHVSLNQNNDLRPTYYYLQILASEKMKSE